MATATRHRGGGFWRGLVLGLILVAAALGLLALLFPPVRFTAPEVPPGAEIAPSAPWQPSAGQTGGEGRSTPPKGLLTAPRGGLLGNPAPAPLLVARPAAEMPPGLPGLSRPQAPDVFQGDASGSPSLFPQGQP